MLLGSFTARFSYGLLVISAPESTDSHDAWNPRESSIDAGPDSLYVGVRDAASGLVSVTCVEDSGAVQRLPLRFSGRLVLPSARLKFYDPEDAIAMTVPVTEEVVKISLYSDDSEEPSELFIYVEGIHSA